MRFLPVEGEQRSNYYDKSALREAQMNRKRGEYMKTLLKLTLQPDARVAIKPIARFNQFINDSLLDGAVDNPDAYWSGKMIILP